MMQQQPDVATIAEPSPARLNNPVLRYWLATRPPFLSVAGVGVLLGLGHTRHTGLLLDWFTALLTLLGALLVHAAVNVLNDYYDSLNGTDAGNSERVYPFTGGSRFIQNRVHTEQQTLRYGLLLLAAGGLIGIGLVAASGPGLLIIGVVGAFLGWAYSAPPFRLNSRGLGEPCVAIGFGTLIPLGAGFVQSGNWSGDLVLVALPYGLLVTNILFINQFPDRRADAAAGKHHWVVRLGPAQARWIYPLNLTIAIFVLVLASFYFKLPLLMAAILPMLLQVPAAIELVQHASQPAKLARAIKLTIAAAVAHGLTLAGLLALTAY